MDDFSLFQVFLLGHYIFMISPNQLHLNKTIDISIFTLFF